MRERRYADAATATSDLAVRAAEAALLHASLAGSDIDCFIVATVTPDHQFPATACLVAARLGAIGKPAFDIEIACSGFIYGLPLAASLIRSGIFRRVMVIGAEKLSSITNPTDRNTAILFGDGAGAVILERSELDSFLAVELGADGRNHEMLWVPGGGSREPMTPEGIVARRQTIHMSGREIFRYAVLKMAETSQSVLERAGLTADDVALVIPHQANRRIIEATTRRLGIGMERVVVNIEKYGNTSSATIPIALSETMERGALKDGDHVLFVGFGGGLSWGAVAWRWAA